MPGNSPGRYRVRLGHTGLVLAVVLVLIAAVLAWAVPGMVGGRSSADAGRAAAACSRQPAAPASVLSGTPGQLAAAAARSLLRCAPAVVLADSASPAALATGAAAAARAHAPMLLSSARSVTAATAAEVRALHPARLLAVGLRPSAVAALARQVPVTTDPAGLTRLRRPRPLSGVAVLVPAAGAAPAPSRPRTPAAAAVTRSPQSAAAVAAAATAQAAGAAVVAVHGYDPRGDPAAISALAARSPRHVLAVGAAFGPASVLAPRLAAAATGVQLPGGGQLIVPMHRIVALYGHPGDPALGVLGQQGIPASVARARQAAAPYRALSAAPVVPAFEIIATVATAGPGPGRSYSARTPVAVLLPWVKAAAAAGMYVILDLQPGRDSFLAQAQAYQQLLELPNVGLALDPEWKLQPGQLPLHQIGTVSSGEVNSVIRWLDQLTARRHLPQKLLVLHQFRLGEIAGEPQLDLRTDNVAIVLDMDGQGGQPDKQQTWQAIQASAPPGLSLGWKNFYVKDTPMLTPAQTMAKSPQPVMISYE